MNVTTLHETGNLHLLPGSLAARDSPHMLTGTKAAAYLPTPPIHDEAQLQAAQQRGHVAAVHRGVPPRGPGLRLPSPRALVVHPVQGVEGPLQLQQQWPRLDKVVDLRANRRCVTTNHHIMMTSSYGVAKLAYPVVGFHVVN